jgi:Mrp family chromosome partitioning ATPase
MLRTQVLQRLDQLGANTLAILSAAASEGKTLTAINLAIAIAAELGRTALLVDFDLRNPSVHKRLGFEPELGVEACLQSGRSAQDVIVRVAGYPRLSVMPARDAVENSSELLTSQRATNLVSELRSRYADRVIVFDLPPVLHGDDTLAFSRSVQAGLFVIAEGRTQRDEVAASLTLLRELPMIGTVLNGSREPQRSPYG